MPRTKPHKFHLCYFILTCADRHETRHECCHRGHLVQIPHRLQEAAPSILLQPSNPAHPTPSSTRLHRKQEQAGTLDSDMPQDALTRKLISPWMPALWVHTGRREGREWQSTGKIFLEVHWKNTWTHWQGRQKQPTSLTSPATQASGSCASCFLLTHHRRLFFLQI